MSRARAKALVLVNWRGVFYERYLLDSHVTALEGTNGAGKTTLLNLIGSLDTPVPFAGSLEDEFLPEDRLREAMQKLNKY